MNAYKALQEKHQEEYNAFPKFFAFGDRQLEKHMNDLGLTMADTDKIISIGAGGYILRSNEKALNKMFDRQHRELAEAIQNDKTGKGFVLDMFSCELSNHEYGFTGDVEDALNAVGLTMDDVHKNRALARGLRMACKAQKCPLDKATGTPFLCASGRT